jgi:multisubunit Na+/H+ antiporter MnhG subunit
VLRLARFDAAGLAQFGDTTHAFLASLAPLIAFPLVGAALMLLRGDGLDALAEFLATLCALLAPPVLSHVLAALWRREGEWLRYATAFNWCQWAIPMVAAGVLLLVALLAAAGVPNRVAALIAVVGLVLYALGLHWFIAYRGLHLTRLRAACLVIGVNAGTAALVLVPSLLTLGAKEG